MLFCQALGIFRNNETHQKVINASKVVAENDTVQVVFQNLTPGTLYNATAYTTVKNVSGGD